MQQQWFAITLPIVVSLAALAVPTPGATLAHPIGATAPSAIVRQQRALRLELTPEGTEARYKVREQLVGIDFPSDAVGKTLKITGALVISPDGKIGDGSKFTVDMTSLATDVAMRDNYVRRSTLQTDMYPTAEFVPTEAKGLPPRLPATGDWTFQLMGNMTVHGVTKPATWQVKAKMNSNGESSGTATTAFKFADYNMTIPKVGRVISIVDSITLDLDFHLVPKPAGQQH